MDDLISRQAAIDAMNTRLEDIKLTWRGKVKKGEIAMYLDMRGVIETLPSAQPEIIRCKECKYQNKFFHEDKRRKEGGYYIFGCELADEYSHVCLDDDFCSRAERRTDERFDRTAGGDQEAEENGYSSIY